jgi:hypothetical protein
MTEFRLSLSSEPRRGNPKPQADGAALPRRLAARNDTERRPSAHGAEWREAAGIQSKGNVSGYATTIGHATTIRRVIGMPANADRRIGLP